MSEKLHSALVENGTYTKPYEEFVSQFSTADKQNSLYEALNNSGDYTKSQKEFKSQFFSTTQEDFPTEPEEVKGDPSREDVTVEGEDGASTGAVSSTESQKTETGPITIAPVSTSTTDKLESNAQEDLEEQYGKYGFDFTQSGIGNNIIITGPPQLDENGDEIVGSGEKSEPFNVWGNDDSAAAMTAWMQERVTYDKESILKQAVEEVDVTQKQKEQNAINDKKIYDEYQDVDKNGVSTTELDLGNDYYDTTKWEWVAGPTGGGVYINKQTGEQSPPMMSPTAPETVFSMDADGNLTTTGGTVEKKENNRLEENHYQVDKKIKAAKLEVALDKVMEEKGVKRDVAIEKHLDEVKKIAGGLENDDPEVKDVVMRGLNEESHAASIAKNVGKLVEDFEGGVFTKGKKQKILEELADERLEELEKGAERSIKEFAVIDGSVVDIDKDLKDLSKNRDRIMADMKEISSQEYTTQEQVDEANAKISKLRKELQTDGNTYKGLLKDRKSLLSAAKILVKDQKELQLEEKDLKIFFKAIGRNYQAGTILAATAANATIDIAVNLEEFAYSFNPYVAVNDFLDDNEVHPIVKTAIATASMINPVSGALAAQAALATEGEYENPYFDPTEPESENNSKFISYRDHKKIELFNFQEEMRNSIAEPMAMEDIETFADAGLWAGTQVAQQLPLLAMMYATGGTAIGTLGALGEVTLAEGLIFGSSFGGKIGGMRREMDMYGKKYSNLQMYTTAMTSALGETLSERITLGQMKNMKGVLGNPAAKLGFKNMLKREVWTLENLKYVGKDFLEEGGSEALATMNENFWSSTVAGEDVNIFDGVKESFVSGLLISGTMKVPGLYRAMTAPFKSMDTNQKVSSNSARINKLERMAQDPNASPENRQAYLNEISDLILESNKLIEQDVKRIDVMEDSEKAELIKIENANRLNRERAEMIMADDSLSPDQKAEEIQRLQDGVNENQKKKREIIEKYPPQDVESKYQDRMKWLEGQAALVKEQGGKPINIIETDTDGMMEYQTSQEADEITYNQGLTAAMNQVVKDPDSTPDEIAEAQEYLKAAKQQGKGIKNMLNIFKGNASNYGAMLPKFDADGNVVAYDLLVNKETSITDGMFNTAAHEFVHAALYNTLKQDPAAQAKFGDAFTDILQNDANASYTDKGMEIFNRRIAQYSQAEGRGEEIAAISSELMLDGEMELTEQGLNKIKGTWRRFAQNRLGYDIKFDTPQDVKNFMIDYHKSVRDNKPSKAIAKMTVKGAKGKLVEGARTRQEIADQTAFSKAVDLNMKSNPDLRSDIDGFVKNEDGSPKFKDHAEFQNSNDYTDAYMKIVDSRLLDGLIHHSMLAKGLDSAALKDFTRKVKDKIAERYATNYNLDKNDSLFGWLTGVSGGAGKSIIYRAKGDVMAEYVKEGIAEQTSIDKQVGEAGTLADILPAERSVEMEAFENQDLSIGRRDAYVNGPVPVLDQLELTDTKNEVDSRVDKVQKGKNKVDLDGLTYKGVKGLLVDAAKVDKNGKMKLPTKASDVKPTGALYGVLEAVAKSIGVDAKRIIANQDLNAKQRKAVQEFLYTKIVNEDGSYNDMFVKDVLPEGETRSGGATGIANTKLGLLYDKGGRASFAEGATAAGKFTQTKRTDVTMEEVLGVFGINPDGSLQTGTASDGALRQAVLSIAQLAGNQSLRENALKNGTHSEAVIAQLGDGKAELAWSRKDSRKQPITQDVISAGWGDLINKVAAGTLTNKEVADAVESVYGDTGLTDAAKDKVKKEILKDVGKFININKNLKQGFETITGKNKAEFLIEQFEGRQIEQGLRKAFGTLLPKGLSIGNLAKDATSVTKQRAHLVSEAKNIIKKFGPVKGLEMIISQLGPVYSDMSKIGDGSLTVAFPGGPVIINKDFVGPSQNRNQATTNMADFMALVNQAGIEVVKIEKNKSKIQEEADRLSRLTYQDYTDIGGETAPNTDILGYRSAYSIANESTSDYEYNKNRWERDYRDKKEFREKKAEEFLKESKANEDMKGFTYKAMINDKWVSLNTKLIPEDSEAFIKNKDFDARKQQAQDARDITQVMLDNAWKKVNDPNNSFDISDFALLTMSMGTSMKSPIRRAANAEYIQDGIEGVIARGRKAGKPMKDIVRFEHMKSKEAVASEIIASYIDSGKLNPKVWDGYQVQVISVTADNLMNKVGYKTKSTLDGSTRLFNETTLDEVISNPGNYDMADFAPIRSMDPSKQGTDTETIGERWIQTVEAFKNNVSLDGLQTQQLGRAANKANAYSWSKNPKGISVLDFDDTLATTKSGVRANIPNPDGTPKPGRKVIFLAGGAGSGKGNVISKLGLKDQGFKIVNSDISLEWLKKNSGLPANMNDFTKEQRSKLGSLQHQARGIARRKQMKYQGEGNGVVVDGTGGSIKSMEKLVNEFKDKGYDVSMMFVETSLPVALERNAARKERSLLDKIVTKNHEAVQGNKDGFKEMFGDRFMEVNTDNLSQQDAIPTKLTDKMNDFVSSYENRRLDAEEFASEGADILDQGGTFDFSEFNKVVEGQTAPLFEKAMKLQGKFGTKDMFVLTARPAGAAGAIHTFLKANGLDIPLENITGLANSTPEAKALWMADKVADGYNDFYFADDALQNVQAVKNMLDQFDVKSKVQQAKADFSYSDPQMTKLREESSKNAVKNVDRLTDPDAYNDIQWSKKHRAEYEKTISKNRPDLAKEGLVSKTVDGMFDFIDGLDVPDGKKRKYEQLTTKWLATSNVKLKEDGYKIKQAVEIAEKHNEDIFSYRNPNEIIEKYAGKTKAKPTNPKNVKEFAEESTEYPFFKGGEVLKVYKEKYGITEHVVEETKEGMMAVRKTIDTHWGPKSNPWCITARSEKQRVEPRQYGYESVATKSEAQARKQQLESEGFIVEIRAHKKDYRGIYPGKSIDGKRVDMRYELDIKEVKEGPGVMEDAWENWQRYSEGPKRIVFQNGRLSSFYAGDQYWDRMDNPTDAAVIQIKKGRVTEKTELVPMNDGGVSEFVMETRTVSQDKKTVTTEYHVESGMMTENEVMEGEKLVENRVNGVTVKETVYNPEGDVYRVTDLKGGKAVETRTFYKGSTQSINNGKNLSVEKHGDLISHEITDGNIDYWYGKVNLESQGIKSADWAYKGKDGKKSVTTDIGFKTPTGFEVMDITKRVDGKLRVDIKKLLEVDPDAKGLPKGSTMFSKNISGKDIMFSKGVSQNFNDILENTTGVLSQKQLSDAQARLRGQKTKYKSIIPASAQDFQGLLYNFLGKGKQGEADMAFFKKALIDPFARGIDALNGARQRTANDYKNLLKNQPDVKKMLKQQIEGLDYTYDQAIRAYLWTKAGFEIPGLSQRDANALNSVVNNDPQLQAFAETVGVMSGKETGLSKPNDYWLAESLTSDLLSDGAVGDARAEHLAEWQENVDQMFDKKGLNKIEAVYGSKFREALEDSLYRMKTGRNRLAGGGRLMNGYMNWVNNSVGAIMFFNMRSAILQTISATNYINWSFNNPAKAAVAFANQPQYWKDFSMIFNSAYLKQRRSGNQRGINEAELSEAVAGSNNKAKAAIAWLLKKGFLPTQIADSFAIASGGATFYRNKVKALVKEGMTQEQAEKQAFLDFQETTEVSQQSARPDMISQQQASPLGRLILSFQNTPMQYARIINKAARDLANGRGDTKTHMSKIAYYGVAQGILFGALQSALFAAVGEDEEEEFDKKKERIINGMIDSLLSGIGYGGKAISTAKNTIREYVKQKDEGWNADHTYTILQLLGFSPPIGSKLRKIYSSIQTEQFNEGVSEKRGLTLDNPSWSKWGNVIEGITNVPLGRLAQKMLNIDNALDANNKWWERAALLLGWNTWDLGIKDKDITAVKEEIKEEKEVENKKKREIKKEQKKKEKEEENKAVIEENKKKSKEDGVCSAVSKGGKRCKTKVVEGKLFCTVHESTTKRSDGKQVQCRKRKSDNSRCKMKTTNKSGYCYYHD